MGARVVLLVTSPRLPAGLLTADAWDTLRAHPVYAASASGDQVTALRAAGVAVTEASGADALLAAAAEHGTVVWLAGPAGDQDLAREIGLRVAREPALAELELMYGSWDPPGARVLDAVAVMDRLASPGGDPWKREQTHQSLAHFLIEETYEAYDAIIEGDLDALREELGDLLLQVVLHARMAEDRADGEPWSIDDVAGDLTAKMIRRNPHVFGDATVADVGEIIQSWERIKREEKSRQSAMDGIALSQPALALAAKILMRAERAGIPVTVPAPSADGAFEGEEALGAALLAMVAEARAHHLDAEAALRRAALAYAQAVRSTERS